MSVKLNSIPEAVADLKKGRMVIVVDDEARENEGDLMIAARHATPQVINFMTKEARGLVCVALTEERCNDLGLDLMVSNNTSHHNTAFTVSVDLKGHGCTTGISVFDRAKTIKALADPASRISDFARPGHIFPLRAKKEGVLRRTGHTEAAIDLTRLAGFEPAATLIEIMNDDGTMARLPQLVRIAKKFRLKIISIKDLVAYRLRHERLIEEIVSVNLPTHYGEFRLTAFRQVMTDEVHLALAKGQWKKDEPVLVRVHSSCVTGDVLGSLRCDCGEQLHKALKCISRESRGVLLYMKQEGRGIGLLNKLKAYKLQEDGKDTVEANLALGFKMDERDYGIGAQILRHIGITKIRLLTNNPRKRVGLSGYGLTIVENIPLQAAPNRYNEHYLRTKKNKMGHEIEL